MKTVSESDPYQLPENKYGEAAAANLKIKDFPLEDRPQEKALAHGCSTLAVPDLLALILRSGLPGIPITDLTRSILKRYNNSIHELERCSRSELLSIKGLGQVKALQLEAIFELIRRYNKEELVERPKIRSSQDIDNVMRPLIANLPHEEIWALYLNRSNQIIYKERVSSGSSTASVFDSKHVLKEAVLRYADAVVLCHNHPSGNLKPSVQDDSLTTNFQKACKMLELRMLDHLILSIHGFYSYNDEGRV